MKVRATKLGYYNNRRQKEGMIFFLKDEKHFSKNWMELVDEKPAKPKNPRVKKSEDDVPKKDDKKSKPSSDVI